MKKLLLLLVSTSLAGCSSLGRPLTDMVLGAGGAVLGHKLSKGDPAMTALGAAGGVAVGEGINVYRTRQQTKAYKDGFTQGRSDGIKEIYWNLQDAQESPVR